MTLVSVLDQFTNGRINASLFPLAAFFPPEGASSYHSSSSDGGQGGRGGVSGPLMWQIRKQTNKWRQQNV